MEITVTSQEQGESGRAFGPNVARLKEALALAQVGYWDWDFLTGQSFWTDEHFRLFGYEPDAFPASFEAFLALVAEEDRAHVLETAERVRRLREPFSIEHHIIWPDGTRRLVHSRGQAVVGPDGGLVRLYGTCQDITERRRLEEEMATRMAELAQARELDRLKSQFVSSVNHELRTPLTSIRGYIEFLQDGIAGPLNESQQEFVNEIAASSHRLLGLVDDLLDFARLEAGSFTLRCSDIELGARVREVVRSLWPQAKAAGVDLRVTLPDEPLTLHGDPYRLGQVLLNLVSNAIKFTPKGGDIEVRAFVKDGWCVCEVSDTGRGIHPGDLPKLFQRFSQLDAGNTRPVGGAGLGLSISKAIIDAHGGSIGVESELGRGSVFGFRLPLRDSDGDRASEPTALN